MKIEYVEVHNNRESAPVVMYMTEDGPRFGVHPDVSGYSVMAYTTRGEVYCLTGFHSEDFETADRLVSKIRIYLDANNGYGLNPDLWHFVRVVYGTPAYLRDLEDRLESHVNAGGTREEFYANN